MQKVEVPPSLASAKQVFLKKGTRVFQPGDPCQHFFFLLSGRVRVDLVSKSGKPVLLYRFGAGETCVLTTSCIMSGDELCGEATVEENVEACIIPLSEFQSQLALSGEFRQLVFSSFAHRLAEMMARIEEVTSLPIDMRLAARLLDRKPVGEEIQATHEDLATDIGTVREVVTRKLAQWEKDGLIRRGRGKLVVVDRRGLYRIAHQGD